MTDTSEYSSITEATCSLSKIPALLSKLIPNERITDVISASFSSMESNVFCKNATLFLFLIYSNGKTRFWDFRLFARFVKRPVDEVFNLPQFLAVASDMQYCLISKLEGLFTISTISSSPQSKAVAIFARLSIAIGSPLPILARIFPLISAAIRISVLVMPLSINSFHSLLQRRRRKNSSGARLQIAVEQYCAKRRFFQYPVIFSWFHGVPLLR